MTEPPIHTPRRKDPVEGGGVVGFVFGLGVGTAAALGSWLFIEPQPWYALTCGLVVGTLGYFFGDRFWYWVTEKVSWFS